MPPTTATTAEASSSCLNRPLLWQWPNILALDAAVVALIWQQWLAPTTATPALVLAFSVWLTYTADRWMDVRGLTPANILTDRHRFSRKWHRQLAVIWFAVLFITLALALTGLSPMQFAAGTALLLCCIAYSLAVHRNRNVPKELFVALIFSAGAAVFQIGLVPPLLLGVGTLCLFLLAFANCSLIAFREANIDHRMCRTSLARQHPNSRPWAFRALAVIIILSIPLAIFLPMRGLALGACAASTFVLGLNAERLPPESFRVLADALLLMPGLLLFA